MEISKQQLVTELYINLWEQGLFVIPTKEQEFSIVDINTMTLANKLAEEIYND